jgi:hypothetical protein
LPAFISLDGKNSYILTSPQTGWEIPVFLEFSRKIDIIILHYWRGEKTFNHVDWHSRLSCATLVLYFWRGREMKKGIVLSIAAVLFCSCLAVADTITYSDTYSGYFNMTNKPLAIPQFDSSLGTLNSVTMTVNVTAFGTIKFENTTAFAIEDEIATYWYWQDPVTKSTKGQLGLALGTQSLASVNWDVREIYALNLAAFDGTTDYAGPSAFSTTYLDSQDSQNFVFSSDLASFIGSNNLNLVGNGSAYGATVMPGNGSNSMTTTGSFSATVIYDYTPVPEPLTLSLLGLGGLLFTRRK